MTNRPSPLWLVSTQEIHEAAGKLGEWGYPRCLLEDELDRGYWFTFGPDIVWWFEVNDTMPSCAGFHMARNPEYQEAPLMARRFLESVRIAACLFGLERLYVCQPGKEVANYVKRLGFREDELGSYWGVKYGSSSVDESVPETQGRQAQQPQ